MRLIDEYTKVVERRVGLYCAIMICHYSPFILLYTLIYARINIIKSLAISMEHFIALKNHHYN